MLLSLSFDFKTLSVSSGVIVFCSLLPTLYLYLEHGYVTTNTNKPKLKVEFLNSGSMKYWIVLGNKQEELKINGKTVDLLTESEVHNVKQEFYRRWLACENEALQKAYEKGYKSKSKLL